ncbi:adaptin N terminal region-domain-containing protein [Powellomyces hirtus]|nr:adaptin N terminal region-domain-containing protein [Powellomyces hirtus]
MRGLTVFIADLRNCRARELEEKRVNKELANIRSKFKGGDYPQLSGRQKKKYVCKLLYMYILGWDVDFGHMEAVNLLSSPKYSEKQIGYLAVTLMISESNELVRLVVNSMRKDLDDHIEIHQCLALQAIANISAREMAEALSTDVMRLMTSGQAKSFVKKKAALCLLRLFRRHPDLIPAKDWADKIMVGMEDYDMGVALAVTSLVVAVAQSHPDHMAGCVPRAISRMHKIVMEKQYSPEYVYYKVPVPWLQVKLLRLLQYYPPPEDNATRGRVMNIIQTILKNARDIPKNIQHNNAQNAILFEAINLAIHMDPQSEAVVQASELLGRFISSKETNIRYLGLETMAHLAGFAESVSTVKKHQETIISSLKDKDISVRRRALDLLYSMCDVSNARVIVHELLQYLAIADYAIREEMVLKIAILTEKFATDYSWYVDVILQLITIAGDNVSDEVWYRVVQIVTNNEDLQEYAVRTVLTALKSPTCHETALKVGGYILGEYGHLIANNPGCTPAEQFMALHSKFTMCTTPTRALLLSTYLKFINVFPEIKDQVVAVFKQYRFVLDVELQQRACEYLSIATLASDELLQVACEEMPPFPQRESALLSRLQRKTQDTEDKRTWQIGGLDANKENLLAASYKRHSRRRSVVESTDMQLQQLQEQQQRQNSGLLDLSDDVPAQQPPQQAQQTAATTAASYARLVREPNGVLYEDANIQIGLKTEYHAALGRIAIFYGNKSTATIANLATDMDVGDGVRVTLLQPIASSIPPATQLHQMYNIECLSPVNLHATLKISYTVQTAHQPFSSSSNPTTDNNTLSLRLPIVPTKFLTPAPLSRQDFVARWTQIGGPPREMQIVAPTGPSVCTDVGQLRNAVEQHLAVSVLSEFEDAVVAAAVWNAASGVGKVGCLIRIELNVAQKMFRLTLRSTNEQVTAALAPQIREIIESF